MKDYLISVVVPVYNAEEYLEHCVDSLLNQTYEKLELILVDDGSSDGSILLCDKYASEDERVKVIHKENGGLISAWKRGASESSGQYLCFVDSDDWVDTNMLEELTAQLSGSDKEIISSDYIIETEDGQKRYIWQELPSGEYKEADLRNQVVPRLLGNEKRYVCLSRCMKLISRELILNNMKYSNPVIQMGEDTTIMLPCLLDCTRLVIMEHKAYYHYLYVTSSMVHRYDRGMYENMRLLRKIILQIITDKRVGLEREQLKEQAEKEYILLLLLVLKNEARGNPSGYQKNITAICKNPETLSLVKKTQISVTEKSNLLLYLTLQHPNHVTISMLRLAMKIYYGGKSL